MEGVKYKIFTPSYEAVRSCVGAGSVLRLRHDERCISRWVPLPRRRLPGATSTGLTRITKIAFGLDNGVPSFGETCPTRSRDLSRFVALLGLRRPWLVPLSDPSSLCSRPRAWCRSSTLPTPAPTGVSRRSTCFDSEVRSIAALTESPSISLNRMSGNGFGNHTIAPIACLW